MPTTMGSIVMPTLAARGGSGGLLLAAAAGGGWAGAAASTSMGALWVAAALLLAAAALAEALEAEADLPPLLGMFLTTWAEDTMTGLMD